MDGMCIQGSCRVLGSHYGQYVPPVVLLFHTVVDFVVVGKSVSLSGEC